MPPKPKIARVATTPSSFVHIEQQIKSFQKAGYDISLVCSQNEDFEYWQQRIGVRMIPLPIARNISLAGDVMSLFRLIALFRKENFTIVHSATPKAGLATAIAAFVVRVPIRYHTFTGQRWATLKGPLRFLLKKLDQLVILLNTHCFADSRSQIEYLRQEGVIHSLKQVSCIGAGSFGGIDSQRFHPLGLAARQSLEELEKLPPTDFRFIYLGRLVEDKGIIELVDAFDELSKTSPKAQLILVGSMDEKMPAETTAKMEKNPQILFLGLRKNPEHYLSASDILVLPSYREGFGTVVLEAAACGIPCIGTKISGLVDAIVDHETGILVASHSRTELLSAMKMAYESKEKMRAMGEKARKRCITDFNMDHLTTLTMEIYDKAASSLPRS